MYPYDIIIIVIRRNRSVGTGTHLQRSAALDCYRPRLTLLLIVIVRRLEPKYLLCYYRNDSSSTISKAVLRTSSLEPRIQPYCNAYILFAVCVPPPRSIQQALLYRAT